MVNPPSDLLTNLKEQKIEGLREADSHSEEGKRAAKLRTLKPSETSASRSHSFFYFLFSLTISSLFCHSPSTVRERLALAVQAADRPTLLRENLSNNVNTVNKENPATLGYPNMHPSFLGQSKAIWHRVQSYSPKLPIPEKKRHHLASPILPDDFNSPVLIVVLVHLTADCAPIPRARN